MNKLSAREREAVFLAAKKTHSWCPSRCFVLQSSAGPVLSFRVRRDTQSFTAPMLHKATCPALCLFTHVRGRQILLSPSCRTVQSALRTIKPQLSRTGGRARHPPLTHWTLRKVHSRLHGAFLFRCLRSPSSQQIPNTICFWMGGPA